MSNVSTRTRFEIFKRDSFKCQYCGKSPPDTVLEIDHIRPKADGGGNESINLVTSCFECNRGKSDKKLTVRPPSVDEVISQQAETIAQLAAYNEFLRQIHKLNSAAIDDIHRHWDACGGGGFTDKDLGSVRQFLRRLGFEEVIDSIDGASARYSGSPSRMFKYFCGICWRKIKDKEGVKEDADAKF